MPGSSFQWTSHYQRNRPPDKFHILHSLESLQISSQQWARDDQLWRPSKVPIRLLHHTLRAMPLLNLEYLLLSGIQKNAQLSTEVGTPCISAKHGLWRWRSLIVPPACHFALD